MPVIAAGLVNKQGHIILSRNFIEISRIRIEGLLSAFPRLLESSTNMQVTFINAGSVRYVYQPLEDLFLVLITTKNSNIVEDLATLHLMGRLIPEYVETVTEETLDERAFEVFFAMDEVIVGGKRENTTVEQIKTYLEMDSHEEMMVREEKRVQMERAKKDAARKAHEMRDKRRKGMNPYSGIGSDDTGYGIVRDSAVYSSGSVMNSNDIAPVVLTQGGGISSGGGFGAATASKPVRAGGLTLGRAKKADITSRVLKESGLPPSTPLASGDAATTTTQPSAGEREWDRKVIPDGDAVEGLHVTVEEKISAQLGSDGDEGAMDIRGELLVFVSDPKLAKVKLLLAPTNSAFSFRAHAKVNKELFASDHVLLMRDGKPLPLQQPVTILRWRLQNTGSVRPPIILSCWPSADTITVEYELGGSEVCTLSDVRITLPLHGATTASMEPSVGTCNISNGCVVWLIPLVDARNNANGNIEVTLANADGGSPDGVFFPVDVSFTSRASIGQVQVVEVVEMDSGAPVQFSQAIQLAAEEYTIS